MTGKKRGRPKAKYSTNPFTGQRQRVPARGKHKDFLTGEIRKNHKSAFGYHSTKRRVPRKMTKSEQKTQQLSIILVGAFVLLYFFFTWASTHIWQAILIGVALLAGASYFLMKTSFVQNFLKKEFKTFSKVTDEETKKLISEIKAIDMQEVRNEEDFEKQVYQWLKAKGYYVERQVSISGRRRIDLVVNNSVALELKVGDRSKNVQDLIGQVTVYKKYYKKILVVILDVGNVPEMSDYIELIQNIDSDNIAVVLIDGDLRRYKKKQEYIMVKKSTSYE